MATHTLTTSSALTAVTFNQSPNVLAPADLAAVAQLVKDDRPAARPLVPGGAFSYNGMLFVPSRGWLKIFVGDVIAVDNQGAVILVPANSISNGNWTFT